MTTPVCPACGAKFSHDNTLMQCKHCGLPDEIVAAGPRAVARWKNKGVRMIGLVDLKTGITTMQEWDDGLSKKQRKRARIYHGASQGNKQRKHGRNTGKKVHRAA